MALDKETLYSTVRDLLDRSDITDEQLDTSVLLVEENFDRELRPILLETYVRLPVDNNLLPLPSDLLEIKMVVREDDTPLFGRQDAQTVLAKYSTNQDRPALAFARVAGNLVFDGYVGDFVGLEYHQTVPSLLSGEPDDIVRAIRVLNYSPNYYIYGLAYHVGLRYGHEQTMEFKETYIRTAGAIQAHTQTANTSGASLIQEGVPVNSFN